MYKQLDTTVIVTDKGCRATNDFRAEWLITNAGPSIAWVPGSDILWGYTHLGKRRLQ